MQNSASFLYTNKKPVEQDSENNPMKKKQNCNEKNKLEEEFNQEGEWTLKNKKTLLKETEKDIKKMERWSVSMDCEINTVEMSLLPKAIYRFNAFTIKISVNIFHRNRTKKF